MPDVTPSLAAGSPAVVLSYQAAGANAVTASGRRWRAASFVALLPGLVVPFVPFACDVVPAEVILECTEEFLRPASSMSGDTIAAGLLALPCFLAFPLVIWSLLRLLCRRTPRAVAAAFGAAGAVGGLSMAGCLAMIAWEGGITGPLEWGIVAGTAMLLCLTLVIVILCAARGGGRDAGVGAALAGPYAAMLLFCLVAYHTDAKLGWYLALAPAAAALGELAVAGLAAVRRAVPAPSD